MNAHVNLGAWWHAQSAGKTGAESVPDTPHEDAAEEGVITAEFAVALPAVTVVLALCLGAASTSRRPRRLRGADSLRRQSHRPGAECADFRFS